MPNPTAVWIWFLALAMSEDVLRVKEILHDIIRSTEQALTDPPPEVYVNEHAESSINMLVRVWVKPDDYWDVYFHMHEQVKLTFDAKNISIPFPQRDVHLFQTSKSA